MWAVFTACGDNCDFRMCLILGSICRTRWTRGEVMCSSLGNSWLNGFPKGTEWPRKGSWLGVGDREVALAWSLIVYCRDGDESMAEPRGCRTLFWKTSELGFGVLWLWALL